MKIIHLFSTLKLFYSTLRLLPILIEFVWWVVMCSLYLRHYSSCGDTGVYRRSLSSSEIYVLFQRDSK